MPKLLVVATPIGNLGDLSPRMREALSSCDLIAAEDTRMAMKLLNHFGIKKPLVSCHRHNEEQRAVELIGRMLKEDLTVALTTDAGTPAISDPGHVLVKAAWEAHIPVSPVAGPSAVAAALSVSGFDAKSFAFYGFPPREKKALDQALDAARNSGVPVAVFYESPHRVLSLVGRIAERFPECALAVFCDLTKKFEWMRRGSPEDVLNALRENPNLEKGEYCVVCDLSALPPPEKPPSAGQSAVAVMAEKLFTGAAIEEAEDLAQRQGFPRNQIYKAKLFLKKLE
ncbi:MAG: 16S rRNA (cytidine(1402)-2'-O)-methyltransferase [Clostridiales bacterium]|nr:16S rRNA (cytidine(1402)-2'-O)-methyltransferase [Clostridiales bacterium]